MTRTTGDPTLDALVALGAFVGVMGVLVALAAPMERFEAIGRLADRLAELVFPARDVR